MKKLLYCFLALALVSCRLSAPTPSALKTDSDSGCFHRTSVQMPVYLFDRVLTKGVITVLFNRYLSDAMNDSSEHRRLLDFKINSVEVQPEGITDSFDCATADGANSISIVDFSVKPYLQDDSDWLAGNSEIIDDWISHIVVYVDVLEENEEYHLIFLDPDS